MNIFVTDFNPIIAAQNLDDKRIKHITSIECLEMLTIYIHSVTDSYIIPFPLWGDDDRQKEPLFLYNNPVSKWVRKDRANVYWLYRYTLALLNEYNYRFEKISPVSHFIEKIEPFIIDINREPKQFQNSSLYKHLPIIEAYRETMIYKWTITDKIKPVKFTKRGEPKWFKQ